MSAVNNVTVFTQLSWHFYVLFSVYDVKEKTKTKTENTKMWVLMQ